jgi:hypothetical protein
MYNLGLVAEGFGELFELLDFIVEDDNVLS